MYHYSQHHHHHNSSNNYRTDSPLSYTSITPTGTPELCGLTPTPRPRLRITSTGFPYDENAALYRPQRRSQLATSSTPAPTPSTAGGSTSSRATFWSAVDVVDSEDEDEDRDRDRDRYRDGDRDGDGDGDCDGDCDFKPGSKADSGILVSPILPPSPRARRESTSSGSTAAASSHRSHPKSTQSSSPRVQRPRHPSRQSTTTSNWTSSSSSTAVAPTTTTTTNKLSRTSTESTLRSPPRAHTKTSRADIATSLQQKYPNDRCHGAFLPFRSEFSHSKDSLCPVRFLPGGPPSTPVSTSAAAEKSVPATPMSETYNGPVMYNTPIDWKGNDARRREYAAADRKQACGWRKWCCGLFGKGGSKVFWDGADCGSVRRYRLDLPPPESSEEESEEGGGGGAVVEKLTIAPAGSGGAGGVVRGRESRERRRAGCLK